MPRFRVFFKGKHENTGNDIKNNFDITRDSMQEAREDALAEAEKRHPHYDLTIEKVQQL